MNSLLQTLFMTPEFKAKLYSWSYDAEADGETESCIPYQLQKLFGRLDLMESEAVGTRALTRSFGWFGNEAFEQHDVQELCRVLFEALDKSFLHRMLFAGAEGPEQGDAPESAAALVTTLYEGIMTGYIDCQACPYVSERNDTFQDIQVPIRGLASITDGLAAFVEPERLEGDNQYQCSGCNAKVDALKGMSIKKLPYLLSLQLARFDFDYMTMSRVKVHDFVTFPQFLDMAPFLATGASAPVRYQLFSIMIHAGGAMGGHYYAYVYSFALGAWFNFNDSKVSPATPEMLAAVGLEDAIAEVEQVTPGGSEESPATAYMLMYRRVDEARNMADVPASAIPEFCLADTATENAAYREHRAKVEHEKNMLKLRVYCGDESPMLRVHSTRTLRAALDEALDELDAVDASIDRSLVRLRAFNPFTKTPGAVYDDRELDSSLQDLLFPAVKSLLLEVRSPGEEFPDDGAGALTLQSATLADMESTGAIVENDYATNFFTPLRPLPIAKTAPLSALKAAFAEQYPYLDAGSIQLVTIDLARGTARVLDASPAGDGEDDSVYGRHGLDDGSCVYAEPLPATPGDSVIVRRFEYEQNLLEVNFNLPLAPDAPPGAQVEYDQVVTFDRRKTLAQLKAEGIAPLLGLGVNEFKLCRNLLSKEYKDEEASLEACGIFDGSAVYVALGAPMKIDEHKIRVFVYDSDYARVVAPAQTEVDTAAAVPAASRGDGGLSSRGDVREARRFSSLLVEVIVNRSITVNDLRARIIAAMSQLEASHPMHVAAIRDVVDGGMHARLRERVNHRAGAVLLGHLTLADALPALKDRHSLALQVVPVETKTSEDLVVVRVQRWLPSTWSAEPVQTEMVVPLGASLGELRAQVASISGLDLDVIRVAKPLIATSQADLQDAVLDLQWAMSDALVVGESPLLLRDGVLLLYKDETEAAIIPDSVLERRPKESGLRIHTRYDDDYVAPPSAGGASEDKPAVDGEAEAEAKNELKPES
ncbi:ubiquitin carboxyl-terminal hydrolase [Thecamonas trahens ATCC 50062]|uniref:Ubiquitin carboxyl-terminal hydrolase 47 n=1 Tax=Thecamonas trahens ATCC 50062 TaxID=461836 RepID=A0A0L0D9I2_THETB|nr:ubiquitin carboxyl-terminal hydrolase [Thecamonas trahens ATCC 50062]KNC48900.1 ubiquitin carboxyl-terminal hydrolase [Thecamonas trahens ATCC 50062]|eukprot:XP_013758318.1 ubiquitin carboxyl-terminal hydrolase [Thecamonas trahens ATCC 50062]